MATNQQHSWQALTFYSLLSFGLATLCFMNLDPRAGIAAESELLETSGKLAWTQEHKYGTRFGLVGIEERFDYPSKANGMGVVRNSLNNAGEDVVSVRYEADANGPVYSDDKYHDVWELTVGGRKVRSYSETAAAWESDNRIVPWLGGAMMLCGIFLGFAARKARRAAQ